jgi:hypothetical protein
MTRRLAAAALFAVCATTVKVDGQSPKGARQGS